MYTVLWRENKQDKWDRFETEEEVAELLDELQENPDVCEGDVLIFTPPAEDYCIDFDSF